MKLAVCLVTADRPEFTRVTLESLFTHNPGLDALLLHADDGSTTPTNKELARMFGFQPVFYNKGPRLGGQRMRFELARAARELGATHVLMLENDIESCRPLPLGFLEFAFERPDVYCVRLYGIYKERNQQRKCAPSHHGKGKGTFDPGWKPFSNPFGETAEIGDAHWGAQPCITRINELVFLHDGTRSEGQSRRKSGKLDFFTVRLMDNVTYHIGAERTPGFVQ